MVHSSFRKYSLPETSLTDYVLLQVVILDILAVLLALRLHPSTRLWCWLEITLISLIWVILLTSVIICHSLRITSTSWNTPSTLLNVKVLLVCPLQLRHLWLSLPLVVRLLISLTTLTHQDWVLTLLLVATPSLMWSRLRLMVSLLSAKLSLILSLDSNFSMNLNLPMQKLVKMSLIVLTLLTPPLRSRQSVLSTRLNWSLLVDSIRNSLLYLILHLIVRSKRSESTMVVLNMQLVSILRFLSWVMVRVVLYKSPLSLMMKLDLVLLLMLLWPILVRVTPLLASTLMVLKASLDPHCLVLVQN